MFLRAFVGVVMFQIVLFMFVAGSGLQQPQLRAEPTFDSFEQCATFLSDEMFRVKHEIDTRGLSTVAFGLGCVKTGEKS